MQEKKFIVLFQGDSITDGNRGRSSDPNHILGHGYAFSVAATLGSKYPDRGLAFINKGISGDTVNNLIQRWSNDTIALKPDVISILVGINDLLGSMNSNSFDTKTFETQYRTLLADTKAKLPNSILVIGEPFILPVGMVKNNAKRWQQDLSAAQEIVKRLATEFGTIYVPFQSVFNEASKTSSPDYWIWDGIHPTYAGHGLMAALWLETVGAKCAQLAVH